MICRLDDIPDGEGKGLPGCVGPGDGDFSLRDVRSIVLAEREGDGKNWEAWR